VVDCPFLDGVNPQIGRQSLEVFNSVVELWLGLPVTGGYGIPR
jgi:hypothetical protein